MRSLKEFEQEKFLQGAKKKINTISKKISFCEDDYNLAVNTHFWAWSNFNIFANFVPLMANNGALESSHQGEFVLDLLAGGRHNLKIITSSRANRQ